MNLTDLNAIDVRLFSALNLFIADCAVVVVLVFYLRGRLFQPGWRDDMAVRGAIGMVVYFGSMLFVRGWGVPLLVLIKHGRPTVLLENQFPIALIGTVGALIGAFCMVRVFTPARWSFWGWLVPFVIGIAASIFVISL